MARNDETASRSNSTKLKVFRIEHDQVRDLLKLPLRQGLRYSIEEMAPQYMALQIAASKARKTPEKQRDLFEQKVLELNSHIQTYLMIAQGRTPLVLPQTPKRGWASPADISEAIILKQLAAAHGMERLPFASLAEYCAQIMDNAANEKELEANLEQFDSMIAKARDEAAKEDPMLAAWDAVLTAYRMGDSTRFNTAVADYKAKVAETIGSGDLARVRFEAFLNESGLFYQCTVMYILAALAGIGTWVALVVNPPVGQTVRRVTFWWLIATFAIHTFTLFSRMYLMDRPLVFVTNLYSSAVFIGWGVVGVCLMIERLYPIGIGNFVGAVLGFATSIIAHNLATSGDTLEMMRAVLDTNFWLATHVTTVTLGYAATFIAGAVGVVYVVLYVLPPEAGLKKTVTIGGPGAKPMELGRVLGQIIYGVVCFATLLSFVGTVLGGIWADQSLGPILGLGSEGERRGADRALERPDPARPLVRAGEGPRHGGSRHWSAT